MNSRVSNGEAPRFWPGPQTVAVHVQRTRVIQQWCFVQLLPCHITQAASASASAGTAAVARNICTVVHLEAKAAQACCMGLTSWLSKGDLRLCLRQVCCCATKPCCCCQRGIHPCRQLLRVQLLHPAERRDKRQQPSTDVLCAGACWHAAPHSTRVQSGRACCFSCVSRTRSQLLLLWLLAHFLPVSCSYRNSSRPAAAPAVPLMVPSTR